MVSRIPRLTWQTRFAVAGLAVCVAAASATAQETDDLGLRGSTDAPPSGEAAGPGASIGTAAAKPTSTDLSPPKPYLGVGGFDSRREWERRSRWRPH